MEAKSLEDTLGDKIAEEFETFYNTVGEVEADFLVNKVASRIAVLRVKPHKERQTKV